jgi:hypothetical protein
VTLIVVEVEAFASALVAAALAPALAAAARRAVAAVGVPVAVLADLLAARGRIVSATPRQQSAEGAAEERPERGAARYEKRTGQDIKAWSVHVASIIAEWNA